MQLATKNSVAVQDIHKVVAKNGFTPKETHITANGEVIRKKDKLFLVTSRKHEYPVAISPAAAEKWTDLQKLPPGQQIRLQGLIPADSQKAILIQVLDFTILSPPTTS